MEKLKITITLYEYDELEVSAKKIAVEDYMEYSENYELNEIENNIMANEYLFFKNGDIANTIEYTGKHEKAGIKELKFGGETYIIKDERDKKK